MSKLFIVAEAVIPLLLTCYINALAIFIFVPSLGFKWFIAVVGQCMYMLLVILS
jgi:hypothetical protein